ncbi:MAG: hypothetical protein PHY93_18380 [Bacteriovorax sp.]|nr:hypothetical protein [Bacteriovorax sp.]
MKKLFVLNALLCFTSQAYAWDYSLKADVQQAYTDNVNLTSTNPISDSYSTFGGYLQTKNEIFKIKFKGKTEKYKLQTENNNYIFDLSLQYKHTKSNDYTFALFKQVYNGTPLVSTDTTSDNSGGRLSTTLSKEFDKETSGYLILNGTYKKYSKIINRNDKIIGASLGLEHYFKSELLINPELLAASNSSTDPYYKNTFYGPSLLISFTPNDKWEIFIDGSYSHTTYSGRSVTTVVRRKNVTADEYQELKSAEIGAIYTLANLFPIQVKYSTNKNTSNNSNSAYKAEILSFSIGMKL